MRIYLILSLSVIFACVPEPDVEPTDYEDGRWTSWDRVDGASGDMQGPLDTIELGGGEDVQYKLESSVEVSVQTRPLPCFGVRNEVQQESVDSYSTVIQFDRPKCLVFETESSRWYLDVYESRRLD